MTLRTFIGLRARSLQLAVLPVALQCWLGVYQARLYHERSSRVSTQHDDSMIVNNMIVVGMSPLVAQALGEANTRRN